jgi:hypothetical protein
MNHACMHDMRTMNHEKQNEKKKKQNKKNEE